MVRSKLTVRNGLTTIELAITIAIMVIPILVVGFVLADSNRGWHTTYNRIYSDVTGDGYVAIKTFDALVRKASSETVFLDEDGSWVEIYYYQDGDSASPDRYAFFFVAGGELKIEYGRLDPRTELFTRTVCNNVSDCAFKQAGQSVQMILTLDNDTKTSSIVSSAVMHN